jgi:hypothetical protein
MANTTRSRDRSCAMYGHWDPIARPYLGGWRQRILRVFNLVFDIYSPTCRGVRICRLRTRIYFTCTCAAESDHHNIPNTSKRTPTSPGRPAHDLIQALPTNAPPEMLALEAHDRLPLCAVRGHALARQAAHRARPRRRARAAPAPAECSRARRGGRASRTARAAWSGRRAAGPRRRRRSRAPCAAQAHRHLQKARVRPRRAGARRGARARARPSRPGRSPGGGCARPARRTRGRGV